MHGSGHNPPAQTPPAQTSLQVVGSPSSQGVPSSNATVWQAPLVGSQKLVWHGLLGGQSTGSPPAQLPLWHVSVWVQRFPSSHGAPSGFGGVEQSPVLGLHVPTAWHWSLGGGHST